MYNEHELVRIARRENNKKRNYLVINQLQGKHIPVSPQKALQMFQELGKLVQEQYAQERILLIGFAETATAIGAAVAVERNAFYLQTTREPIPDVDFLFFSEEHSHATEQKLVKNDLDAVMDQIDRIVFIEDEVTTGKTILNIVNLLQKTYSKEIKYGVASILNGMEPENRSLFEENGINLLSLVAVNHKEYGSAAELMQEDGSYVRAKDIRQEAVYTQQECCGYQNARRLVKGSDYQNACNKLWKQIEENLEMEPSERVLVLGTEEFMYPALWVARQIEQKGAEVFFHATTRSPIAVSEDINAPLHTRYELRSVYDSQRTTFLYDLEKYDKVLIITDAKNQDNLGVKSLVKALIYSGNTNISVIWWKEDCDD